VERSAAVRERTVEVAGADGPMALVVAEAGEGQRPLLLVHGFTGAKEDFTEWLEPLAAAGWHAVAPDQRGHGASHQPEAEDAYSFDHYAADLLGLLDALGWGSAAVLGHSMGGMVVQTAALQAPDRFEALVLMDTSHRALRADAALVELGVAIARAEGMAAVMAAQDAMGEGDGLGTSAHQRLRQTRPGYADFGARKMLASSPAMYCAMLTAITDAVRGVDRLPDLASLTAPTLVIVGDEDTPFLKPSRRMAETIPGAELAVVPDAGHAPQFENPDAWWSALTRFLSRL
jgi:pimeloyl-ACP methyl ester carboxylesterase